MNKKGLTLVELMAVIVILSLIALIITPNAISAINRYRDKMYETQLDNIISGAKNWAADMISERHCLICVPEDNLITDLDCSQGGEGCVEASMTSGKSTSVTLAELEDDGYVKENLENPKTDKPFNRCLVVVITMNPNTKDYVYTIPNPDTNVECE